MEAQAVAKQKRDVDRLLPAFSYLKGDVVPSVSHNRDAQKKAPPHAVGL
jgi:hypothetical protein